MPIAWQTVNIPLAAGLSTRADPRAMQAPGLAVCQNAQFDEIGGIQLRHPYGSIGTNILGGGTLGACRRMVVDGDELLVFTSDALYSWSARDSAWVLKAAYLAPKVDEASVFVRTSDQYLCDRAELSGVIIYTWVDVGATSTVYLAALDSATGAVLLAPTAVIGTALTRPRLIALVNRVVLFVLEGSDLKRLIIDPAALSTAIAATPTTVLATTTKYDVSATATEAVFVAARTGGASYLIGRMTSAGVVTSSSKARTCDGPIAVAVSPDLTRFQVVRANATAIQGDLVNATSLADVFTAQAIGTTGLALAANQIAAAYRSVQNSSVYRCYAFWSCAESAVDALDFENRSNWVSTGNTLGTAASFVSGLGVASRAFDYNGSACVWLAFAGESTTAGMTGVAGIHASLQNTYFLYRDDGLLIAKAVSDRAGGFVPVTGHLPNVQALGQGSFAWCGVERRVIDLGGSSGNRHRKTSRDKPNAGQHTGYGARAPREIRVQFDSDEARRTAKLGQTLYVAGGQILQYDGVGLAEVGFHVYPWFFSADVDLGTGVIEAGTYTYKATYAWENAKGELDRSTTASSDQETLGSPDRIVVVMSNLTTTAKAGVSIEGWRTLKDPTVEAPFYLITSKDPAAVTGSNAYTMNDRALYYGSQIVDNMLDADLAKKEINPENGAILESLAPPAASIITANQDRIFLAGVAGDPDRVWYSKLRAAGEVASFHDALTIDVPPSGGAITALAFMDETLIVFRETAVYAFPGEGFDNASGGQNYGPARLMAADTGARRQEVVALTPAGLIFHSSKGWCLLGHGGSVEYIGAPVYDFDADTFTAVHVLETQHQVRCVSEERVLVFDYLVQQWAEWTIEGGLDAGIWNGVHAYLTDGGVSTEQAEYTAVSYGLDIETAWIKLADLQGYQRIRWLMILGEYRSAHALRVRVARDYLADGEWFDDRYWAPSPTTVGGPEHVRHGPSIQKCGAIKVRLTTYAAGSEEDPPTGEALRLTGLALEVGSKRGLYKMLPTAQKQ